MKSMEKTHQLLEATTTALTEVPSDLQNPMASVLIWHLSNWLTGLCLLGKVSAWFRLRGAPRLPMPQVPFSNSSTLCNLSARLS